VRGFEPPTPCSRSRCATRLRYTPNLKKCCITEGFLRFCGSFVKLQNGRTTGGEVQNSDKISGQFIQFDSLSSQSNSQSETAHRERCTISGTRLDYFFESLTQDAAELASSKRQNHIHFLLSCFCLKRASQGNPCVESCPSYRRSSG
jgi:hypothetical protein